MSVETYEILPEELAGKDLVQHHRYERILLLIGGLFILTNITALALLRQEVRFIDPIRIAVWTFCAVSGHIILNRYLPRRDILLFPIVLFLTGWGLVLIDRLLPAFATRQTIWLAVSVTAMLMVAIIPDVLRWLRSYRYLWLIFGLGLLLSTIILGSNPSGQAGAPRLWLNFGGIFFQPSEALKIILVVFLASYLGEQYPSLRARNLVDRGLLRFSPRLGGPVLLMWGLSVIILIWQRDLGTAILFFTVFMLVLYVASGYRFVLLSTGVLIIVAAIVGYRLFDVVQLRIDIWLNPWPEADGRAYQIVQSLQALAAGGIFGQGIGQGLPIYIPVVHSDFIFSALAEEYGLIGVTVVTGCLLLIIMRGLRIATIQQTQPFHILLTIGISITIAVQSLLIMGGTIRLLPLTGVTLPFLSYGGSSLLASFVMIGLLLRLSNLEK